jgi:hypothetical protein
MLNRYRQPQTRSHGPSRRDGIERCGSKGKPPNRKRNHMDHRSPIPDF